MICDTCRLYLFHGSNGEMPENALAATATNNSCVVCFNLWNVDECRSRIGPSIRGCINEGSYERPHRFSRHRTQPTFRLPGAIVDRYRWIAASLQRLPVLPLPNDSPRPVQELAQDLKKHVKTVLYQCLDEFESEYKEEDDEYPICIRDEELGYLCVHVVLHTECHSQSMAPPAQKQRKTRKQRMHPEQDQGGGDPRVQFEQRLQQELGVMLWSLNQALDRPASELPIATTSLDDMLHQWNISSPSSDAMSCYATVWRRPFYIRSLYTKVSRDISQTPFFVTDRGTQRRRLGRTSVEEVITPYILEYCHGIVMPKERPAYGRVKFHASGREDIDVRMLLPPISEDNEKLSLSHQITGRPFVYEIIDARQIPLPKELQEMVRSVNHGPPCATENDNSKHPAGEALLEEWERCRTLRRSYGNNPLGVDISPDVSLVPSRSFQLLQEETELKIKHYECYCWCERPVNIDWTENWPTFPLEIQQTTPIRVLHRRSNLVRPRTIYTCSIHPVDPSTERESKTFNEEARHYFRLHLSTSAGTYVKEFVHGDLGRTHPNLSIMLGGRADILELDCTGIQS
jgi:tRNA U54 and U55 pseudouridine synthase Pus10